jgi:hypothetical protein
MRIYLSNNYKNSKMKKILSVMQGVSKKKISLLAVFAVLSSDIFAQKQASAALKAANDQLDKMVSPALTLFMSICGLFALVGGAIVAYKLFNGDTDSAKKIGGWVGGLVVACVVSMVVKNFFFA